MVWSSTILRASIFLGLTVAPVSGLAKEERRKEGGIPFVNHHPRTVIEQLDAALLHFAEVAKKDLGADVNDVRGAGAAGGLGGGFIAFLNGELRSGVDIVLDAVDLNSHLEGADVVVTGEGCLDHQTVYSKAPIGVAERATSRGIPVISVSGSLGERYTAAHEHGIAAAMAITSAPMTLEEASARAAELIADTTEQAFRFMEVGGRVFGGSA